MLMTTTDRPRNVDASRTAAILYGDWGTSKAYVIGLAFVIAGYASFWPILAVSILSLFVGFSYIIICKFSPNGGGVYASVRKRTEGKPHLEWLAILGAFLLIADCIVTAALSAFTAFGYFGVANSSHFAALFILVIGIINYIGPRHSGTFALIVAIAAVAVFTGLALFSLPFLGEGLHNLQPYKENPFTFWTQFCAVIVALSGIETIANTTSIMKLNSNSTSKNPSITDTSTPAILIVMFEVVIYTLLFGLAATAISHFQIDNQTISAPGFSHVENYMLKYLALIFGGDLLGSTFGTLFSQVTGIVIGLILLSAVNTAINGLISLQYLMASDGELPRQFRKINKYGTPLLPLLIAAVVPAILVLIFKKLTLLADLYAIGFTGAIAVNLWATSTDKTLALRKWERIFMFSVFLIMGAIGVTLFLEKAHARNFVVSIMAVGLALKWLAKSLPKKIPPPEPVHEELIKGATLCAVRHLGKAVRKSIEESNQKNRPLNIIIFREQGIISDEDLERKITQDPPAEKIVRYIEKKGNPELVHWEYRVTDSFFDAAVSYAQLIDAPRLIVDSPHSKSLALVRGNYIERLHKILPAHIALSVISK